MGEEVRLTDKWLHSAPVRVLIEEVSVKVGVSSLNSRMGDLLIVLLSSDIVLTSFSSGEFSKCCSGVFSFALSILTKELEGTFNEGGCRSATDPVSVVSMSLEMDGLLRDFVLLRELKGLLITFEKAEAADRFRLTCGLLSVLDVDRSKHSSSILSPF